MDFVLWKPSKPGEPSWASPAGIAAPGRPGWHIECSAMADRWLWEEAKPKLSATGLSRPHTFDIHGGGIDLVFPHHENEIAQSRCAYGTEIMAQIWMHNGFLQVEGEKMAKSLGNFVTVHELLATSNFGGSDWPGEAIRFAMLRTHYRQPLDWTFVGLDEAHKTLWEWYGDLEGKGAATGIPGPVLDALSDDLNTPKAIAEMHRLHSAGHWGGLRAALGFLGFSGERTKIRRSAPFVQDFSQDAANTVIAAHHARRRPPAGTKIIGVPMPLARDDEIKNRIAKRNAARQAKNFKEADRIRDELAAMGITLKDAKDPKTGELTTTWEVAR
jgi:cysteinyl-tRNA synthetase